MKKLEINLEDENYIRLERFCRAFGTTAEEILVSFCSDLSTGYAEPWGHDPEDIAVTYVDATTGSTPNDFCSWCVRTNNADFLADLFEYQDIMNDIDPAERTPNQKSHLAFVQRQLEKLYTRYTDEVWEPQSREEAMREAREMCKIYG